MALTIGEATDVNVLLDWMLGVPSHGQKTDEQASAEAQAAAERLADKANKALSAGIRSVDVRTNWVRVEACPWIEGCPRADGGV